MLTPCAEVAEGLGATLINMRFVKPIDIDAIQEAARSHDYLVTVEENAVQGGAGSAVNEVLAYLGTEVSVLNLGLPDRYVDPGIQRRAAERMSPWTAQVSGPTSRCG